MTLETLPRTCKKPVLMSRNICSLRILPLTYLWVMRAIADEFLVQLGNL
jgi:hypothetical protein